LFVFAALPNVPLDRADGPSRTFDKILKGTRPVGRWVEAEGGTRHLGDSLTVNRLKLQTAVLKWFVSEEYAFEQETVLQNSVAAFTQPPSGGLLDIGVIVGNIATDAATAAANLAIPATAP
jgi:hypothetical protein